MIVFNWYKGKKAYTYTRRMKRKLVKNPISGHSWYEDTPLNVWDIHSPISGSNFEMVRSEEKAIEQCEKYGLCDIYIPLTQRELELVRHELV